MRADDVEASIRIFNEAVLQPDLWPAALAQIALTFGASGAAAQMVGSDGYTALTSPSYADLAREFIGGGWHLRNRRMERGLALTRAGWRGFITEYQMFSPDELARDPYQQEFAPRHEVDAEAGVLLACHGGSSFVLTTPRSLRKGSYTPPEIAAMNRLVPQLANSCELALRMKLGHARSVVETADRCGQALALLAPSGASLFHTAAFEALLDGGLRMRAGRIHAADEDSDRPLQALIAKAGMWSAADGSDLQPVVVKRRIKLPLIVRCLPISGAARDFLGLARTILVIDDLSRSPRPPSEELVGSAFGLTAAEARLAVRLAAGELLREAAEAERISYESARTRLKAIFAKTGANRQAELSGLLNRLAN